jgi:hypothetical protein
MFTELYGTLGRILFIQLLFLINYECTLQKLLNLKCYVSFTP